MITEDELRAIEARHPVEDYYEEDRKVIHDDIWTLTAEVRRLYRAQRTIYRLLEVKMDKIMLYDTFAPQRIVAHAFEPERFKK